jgi:hypothetical protein
MLSPFEYTATNSNRVFPMAKVVQSGRQVNPRTIVLGIKVDDASKRDQGILQLTSFDIRVRKQEEHVCAARLAQCLSLQNGYGL